MTFVFFLILSSYVYAIGYKGGGASLSPLSDINPHCLLCSAPGHIHKEEVWLDEEGLRAECIV